MTQSTLRLLPGRLSPPVVAGLATFCAAAGTLTVYSSARALTGIWLSDDLKSMGLIVPFISWLLILRAWRSVGWQAEGSWWGFVLLAGSAALTFVRDQMLFFVTFNKDWLLQLPPLPLVAVLYATGLVLLFGGRRLLRAAWFPVLFMWAVIPVPQTFSRRVDLPLQHASAHIARGFAGLLHQPLTQDKLRLMFTPDFGMFIAPGCNGIRGAITLGMAAVVVGYLYRFRWKVYLPAVLGAVMLGYLFNFLRLCLLVIYYKIALPYPWLQQHAKVADYWIGGGLFVSALLIFFAMADKLRREAPPVPPAVPNPDAGFFLARVLAVLALSAVFGLEALHQYRVDVAKHQAAPPVPPLPANLGGFSLVRTWSDTLLDGVVVYTWGEYAAPDNGPHVDLGISPVFDVHDAEICHIARGEDPMWHGQIDAPSAGGDIALTAATYNNGAVQKLEASTVCDGGACKQYSETSQHLTMVYARPHRDLPLQPDQTRPVPVMLRVETGDVLLPDSVAEARMAAALKQFLSHVDLVSLTKPYSQR